jgi:hypothetical protein
MSKYEFAIHGIEGEFLNPNDAIVIMRSTQAGLAFTLPKGGGNWVHFALTSPKFINDKAMKIQQIWFRCSVGDDAIIDSIAVHDESDLIYESSEHLVGRSNEVFGRSFDPHQINSGIIISFHVGVNADGAEINIMAVGMVLTD